MEDNQSCVHISNTLETKRTKHIDVKFHFVKDLVSKGKFLLKYVPTEHQTADVLTKALNVVKFTKFRKDMCVE